MRRKWLNAGLGAGGFIGFVGFLWHAVVWILDAVGRVQTAKALYDSGPVTVHGVTINWGTLYFWLFIFCIAFLGAANYDWISLWYKRRAQSKSRTWDTTAEGAIKYIALGTLLCQHFSDDMQRRISEGATAFMEAAQKGRIQVAGCGNDTLEPKRIPTQSLKGLVIDLKFQNTSNFGYTLYGIVLKTSGEPQTTAYTKLFVDGKELRRIWPPIPSQHGWMAR